MVLTKTEKINLVKSLSSSHKDELRKAVMMGQGGGGIKSVLHNIADTLKPIVKVVGMTVLKEVLIPAVKAKVMGEGKKRKVKKKVAGGALRLAGKGISIPVPPY